MTLARCNASLERCATNRLGARTMTTELAQLPNGLRVVSHHMPHVETVSLGVWIAAGARHESIAEHRDFAPAEHGRQGHRAAQRQRDIAEEIEAVGGELNAAQRVRRPRPTSRAFFRADIAIALDILADILQQPRYAQDELEREREVILQEIAATRDSPDEIAYEMLQEAAFPGQVAIGRSIPGTQQQCGSLRRRRAQGIPQGQLPRLAHGAGRRRQGRPCRPDAPR